MILPFLLAVLQPAQGAQSDLAAIEVRVHGRLGVAALDLSMGRRVEFHADVRFPFCSTFKCLLAADVLFRVDHGQEALARRIAYGPKDLLDYSPVTQPQVSEGGLPVSALCAGAVGQSDNTAANLLLQSVGGPAGLTRFLRALGDPKTRLDRAEPDLNSAIPGDERDTTTPSAMLADLQSLLTGDRLAPDSRHRLEAWLVASTTGADRIRAGVPPTWRVGDKTGTGNHGTTNDVAILRPPGRQPILCAVFLTECEASLSERNAALRDVAKTIAAEFGTGSGQAIVP